MSKEIERKFLICGTIPFNIGQPRLIKQAYIFHEKGKHLRIRICDGIGTLGLKYTGGLVRDEFEYEVSIDDAVEMYIKSELKVEKIRFNWESNELNFDMDYFPNGIKYIEIEFPNEDSSKNFNLEGAMGWLGEEITGKPEYSNITFAKQKLSFNG